MSILEPERAIVRTIRVSSMAMPISMTGLYGVFCSVDGGMRDVLMLREHRKRNVSDAWSFAVDALQWLRLLICTEGVKIDGSI